LQTIERGYFGGEGQSLGLISTRAAGQPYLLRYVYNELEDAFVDLSSINTDNVDLNANDLQTTDLFSVQGLADATIYDADDELGEFVGRRLRLVKNEVEDTYVDLFSSNIGNPAAVSGERIATTPALPSISINGARFYLDYPDQGVFAPENYLYNPTANAFIDPRSTDADESMLTSASLDELIQIEGIRLYVLNADSGLYAPPNLVYNDSVDSFIDLDATEIDEDVDLSSVNLLDSELADEVDLIPPGTVSGDLLNYENLVFADSDPDKTYVLAPDPTAETLQPGYRVGVGLDNFAQLWEDRSLLEPLVRVFIWTFVFAFLSVVTTFAVGLFMAIILNDARMPAKKLIRSLLIIPYAIPGVIAIVVWRGMLNENLGIVTQTIAETFGVHIPWFSNGTWAKIAILVVNLWLGYPYMMLICSGALQAIPSEVYEAAAVDGAKAGQRFWNITLPLLLITVGPLLIASFVFNFNNYLLIEALTSGNPPIPGTATPAGETDILISYTYNLAFGGRGADYGYASAITIVIFTVVALITLFQFRFTRRWEEAGQNV
jgi:ABC-type sugar transport system permease subunit